MAGRFDDNFIEHRRMLLEKWINRIIRNPVLRNSEVIKHFLTCTDEDVRHTDGMPPLAFLRNYFFFFL